jgi:hypothetical protein
VVQIYPQAYRPDIEGKQCAKPNSSLERYNKYNSASALQEIQQVHCTVEPMTWANKCQVIHILTVSTTITYVISTVFIFGKK